MSLGLNHSSQNSSNSRTSGKPEIQPILSNLFLFLFPLLECTGLAWPPCSNMTQPDNTAETYISLFTFPAAQTELACAPKREHRQRQTPTHILLFTKSCQNTVRVMSTGFPQMLFDHSKHKRSRQQRSKQQQAARFICMYVDFTHTHTHTQFPHRCLSYAYLPTVFLIRHGRGHLRSPLCSLQPQARFLCVYSVCVCVSVWFM